MKLKEIANWLFLTLLLTSCRSPLGIITPKSILFVQGDHMPETGYPHSRVRDAGTAPESFSRLRSEVLERELGFSVNEFVLSGMNRVSLPQIMPYAVVVLGSNARDLEADEVHALNQYYAQGRAVLVYADFQYGPNNWSSDNSFLNQFGIEVFPDNFQPKTRITDTVSSHPILKEVTAIEGEGISQFRVASSVKDPVKILAKCSPLTRSGCILQPPEMAKLRADDEVACVWVRENAAGGRLAGVCDRNLFHNGPGPGSDIDQADNRKFAINLFAWLAKTQPAK
jgi:hypothetical protein